MGKTLGIIALTFGIIGLVVAILTAVASYFVIVLSPFIFFPIPILSIIGFAAIACLVVAIICGAIGIKKDDKPGFAIAGLALGTLGFLPQIIFFLVFAVFPTLPF